MEVGGAFGPQLKQLVSRVGHLFKSSGRDLVEEFCTTWAAQTPEALMSQVIAVANINGVFAQYAKLMRGARQR